MTTDVVVDACVAIKWFVAERDSDQARKLFAPEIRRHAPDFALMEITNALWKAERRGHLTAEAASEALESAPKFFWSLPSSKTLLDDALRLGMMIDHPVYDCIYVVLSQRLTAPMITSDVKLVGKLADTPNAAHVVLLRDWKA